MIEIILPAVLISFLLGVCVGGLIEKAIQAPINRKREATIKRYRDFLTELNKVRVSRKQDQQHGKNIKENNNEADRT